MMVVNFGTPVLRKRGARVESVTPAIQQLIADMIETMHAYKGIGLAAQQVGVAIQLTVVDVRGVTDRPSSLEIEGKPAEVDPYMPMVLLNPQITPLGPPTLGTEGCLSFPEIYADVARPESIEVRAMDGQGNSIQFRCGGLLARAIQHEADHLNGILFIDRMAREIKEELRPELEALQEETKRAEVKG